MRARRCSEAQLIPLWPQAERGEQPISLLCRARGMTATTCSRGRQAFGGLTVSDAPRLRPLEQAHARLTRVVAARDLAVEALRA